VLIILISGEIAEILYMKIQKKWKGLFDKDKLDSQIKSSFIL